MSSTTLRRTHDILKQTQQQPRYRAVLNVQDDCNVAIGLGVQFAGSIEDVSHIWAQDLLADGSVDIRDSVKISGKQLIIPGELIDRVGTSAGAWTGSNKISIYESVSRYKADAQKAFNPGAEMVCSLELDLDARTVKLTIDGVQLERVFTETVTSVNYIGFAVRNTETLFSEPVVERD